MNTFQDLRQKLLELYKEALKQYPIDEETDSYNPMTQLEDKIEGCERENYIIEEIKNMDDDYQHDFLSLLALYYFMFTRYAEKPDEEDEEEIYETDEEENEDEKDSGLYGMILNDDLEDVIKALLDDETNYLFDALSLILDEDIETIEPSALKEGKIGDFEEYAVVDEVLGDLTDTAARAVYDEFHPNIEEENKNHKEYLYNDKLTAKLNCMSATSLADFIEKFTVAKRMYTKKRYLDLFLFCILNNTKAENIDVYNKIALHVIKYYYIKGLIENRNNNEELEYTKLETLSAISTLPDTNIEVTKSFLDYDFVGMMKAYYALPVDKREEVDKTVSLDYRKTYGNEGKWVKYTPDLKEIIYKYKYYWYSKIEDAENNGDMVYIYLSVNENDCYSIPRLCVIADKNDKIIDVLGRREKVSVEKEMLKNLEVFVRRFINYDDIKVDIDLLTKLKEIEEKVDTNKELSKKEIDFLFEIECDLPSKLLFHPDIYNKKIQSKANMKKAFATYFDCSEEEVAETKEELNDKTKVVLFDLDIVEEKFPYPNLVAVYGGIYAYNITESESLQNIKYVRYTITAPDLKEKNHIQDNLLSKVVVTEATKRKRK